MDESEPAGGADSAAANEYTVPAAAAETPRPINRLRVVIVIAPVDKQRDQEVTDRTYSVRYFEIHFVLNHRHTNKNCTYIV
jgi:hypothetical protein